MADDGEFVAPRHGLRLQRVEIPREFDEPLVMRFIASRSPEDLGQRGHDGRDGALGKSLRARPVERVLAQTRVLSRDGVVIAAFHAEGNGVKFREFPDDEFGVSTIEAVLLAIAKVKALQEK